jgi:hypothetical protein
MVAPPIIRERFIGALLALQLLSALVPSTGRAAGVTIITHGFGGDAQGWVLGMAGNIPGYYRFPGTNVICYEVRVTDNGGFAVTPRKIAGGHPTNDFNAEIVIKLDWGDLAGIFSQYDTYEVAAAVVPRLLQTNFIAELNGHALAELPLHLIGHSRGGSLVCQMSRLLGTNGVWVDQVTTLDPHPVNEDGNIDPLFISDAPLRIYENVLFADNYYQEFDGYPHGQFMASSYNRRLTSLPGGYSTAHSDMHLWYHATIDLFNPADDTEALLYANDRATWFTSYETSGVRAGFHFSRMGGGNRLSADEPAGVGSDRPAYGYSQRWNFGAGTSPNRTALPVNHGNWPNLIRFNLAGTNLMAQGQSNAIALTYQWAKPAISNATVSIYLDDDFNPWNGNEQLVRHMFASGTTSSNVGAGTAGVDVATTNTTPGVHSVYAKISGGGRTRYLYAPELLTVFSSFQPPTLAIDRSAAGQVRVQVNGIPGQRVVLESTTDVQSWQLLTTNWLVTNRWSYPVQTAGNESRFYRGRIQ